MLTVIYRKNNSMIFQINNKSEDNLNKLNL